MLWYRTGQMVVRRQTSRTRTLSLSLILGAVAAGMGVFLYTYGLHRAGFDRMDAQTDLARDGMRIQALETENRSLRQSLALAQRSIQMDQAAYHDLNQSLKRSATEITSLEERVGLYQAILSPTKPLVGVTIEGLTLRARDDGGYHYRVVLAQPLDTRGVAYGALRLTIQGEASGVAKTLQFPGPVDKAIAVDFKYFQDIEGALALPADFSPSLVTVTVDTAGHRVERSFRWLPAGSP